MLIALAGRRVDASDATQKRFPAENASTVKQQIRDFLQSHDARALVCAAACGADILALEAAGELGLRRRIVLPFDKSTFRASSVVDRGGDWGERYDRIISEVEGQGDLVEFAHDKDDGQTYFTGNLEILDQAQWLAGDLKIDAHALVVWNGESRGEDDVTGHFKHEAQSREMGIAEIMTM
ncbi:MAG: hypothetical protein MOB07_08930 [Acidobacteria bacterium]|nr:hypothetical protein [Acidobacteriota bacterium]